MRYSFGANNVPLSQSLAYKGAGRLVVAEGHVHEQRVNIHGDNMGCLVIH